MTSPNNDMVESLLRDIGQDDVPDEVNARLRSQLAAFRTQLAEAQLPAAHQPRPRRYVLSGAAAAAASIALFAALLWGFQPQTTLAEIVAAVHERPWVHVTITGGDGQPREVWYSPRKDVSAWRNQNWIEFHDHTLEVYESYDVQEQVLYRVPEYTPRRMNRYSMLAVTLPILLRDERLLREPLEKLAVLGNKSPDLEVIGQGIETVREHGQTWLDYRLILRHPAEAKPMLLVIRADPQTKLPHLCRIEGEWEGSRRTLETRFSYPEEGPADIFALGVPQSATVVSRIPSDDVQRILDTYRAGRTRMDNYRAILVSTQQANYWWLNVRPMILYRKGDKFRADNAYWRGDFPAVEEPAEDVDLESWWRRRAEDFVYMPTYIVHGSTVFNIDLDGRTVSGGSFELEVGSVERRETNVRPDDRMPPYWSWRPEFVCRPPLGIGGQDSEPVLELKPSDGPADSVLLSVKRVGRMPAAPGAMPEGLVRPDAYRTWLHPARDYAAVRWEMLDGAMEGEESIVSSVVIDEMARSPGGVWHATRFRNMSRGPDGEEIEEEFQLYIDFDVNLPDTLFEPPPVGHRY